MKRILMLACLTVAFLTCQARNRAVESPDGSVTVMVGDTTIVVSKNGQEVQTIYVNMPGKKQGRILKHRKKKYEMLSGKRRKCLNVSNDCLYTARSGSLMVKVFNDGVAYKIFAPTLKVSVRAIDVAPGIAGMMNDYMYMDTSPESRFQIPEQDRQGDQIIKSLKALTQRPRGAGRDKKNETAVPAQSAGTASICRLQGLYVPAEALTSLLFILNLSSNTKRNRSEEFEPGGFAN